MARFTEDMSVFSVNMVREGKVAKSLNDVCGKLWSSLHPLDGERFLQWVEETYHDAIEKEQCRSWINHRNLVFDPEALIGILDQYLIHQQPKDMVVTFTNAAHFGVNAADAPNYAESINFAPMIGEQLHWTQQSCENLRQACWGRCHELPVINVSLLLSKFDEHKKIENSELDEEWIAESRLSLILQDIQDVVNGKRVEIDGESAALNMLRDAVESADERKVREWLTLMDNDEVGLCKIRERLKKSLNFDDDEEQFIFSSLWEERMDRFERDIEMAKQLPSMFYLRHFFYRATSCVVRCSKNICECKCVKESQTNGEKNEIEKRKYVRKFGSDHFSVFVFLEVRCKKCGKKYKNQFHLNEHIKAKHWGVQFRCFEFGCRRSFSKKSDLARHVTSVHTRTSRCVCRFCQKPLSRPDALARHIRTQHSLERASEDSE